MTYDEAVLSAKLRANETQTLQAIYYDKNADAANAEKFFNGRCVDFKQIVPGISFLHSVKPEAK